MSEPIERKVAPNTFRDQYAGGLKEDPEVEAALSGAFEDAKPLSPRLQEIADRRKGLDTPQFGPMVKLR